MATDISNKNLHWRVGNRTYGNGAAQYDNKKENKGNTFSWGDERTVRVTLKSS